VVGAVIPFDVERLNVGGAMNLATGVFTAPVDGIYHFEFSAMKSYDGGALDTYVTLQVNGGGVSLAYASAEIAPYLPLSGISASLRLKTGDQVRLYKETGALNDYVGSNHYTHFTGWLVEEDLILV